MIQSKRAFNNSKEENTNMYISNMDSSSARVQETLQTLQQPSIQANTTLMNSISEITCNNLHGSRKRQRELQKDLNASTAIYQGGKFLNLPQFLDDDIILQIQGQQSEIDQYIAQHVGRLRLELEDRRKKQSRMLLSHIQEEVMKKLIEKDEEIVKMRKLNMVLEDRVKSLSIENQLWRDLAQTNEATANSLRSNLEQALAQVSQERQNGQGAAAMEDAESCCGSTDNADKQRYMVSKHSGDHAMVAYGSFGGGRRMCRRCGVEESKVLLLPCRHLCLCASCATTVFACPICNSIMNGSVRINTLHQILPQAL